MTFPFNLYLLAFAAAWLVTFASMPLWRVWCQRTGLVDDPGHRKIHDRPIVLAGGLAVLTGLLLPIALAFLLFAGSPGAVSGWLDTNAHRWLEYGLGRRAGQLAIVLLGAVGMTVLGWFDDRHELSPGIKFLGQVVIASAVAAAGVRVTLFIPSALFSYAVTILWILTITNALNFMDNMNGLCAGIGAVATWCFAWGAAVQGQYLVVLLALATCGALLGFLPYNYPRASAFLGDAGSHLVGYLLAVLAILPHFYSRQTPHVWAVLSPVLILAVPLADLVSVVIIRWRKGQPFYVGDNNHFSHRLVRRGWSKPDAVALLWLLGALAGALSFL